jgi:regulator of protease activity HflC (stomatin/prohibitin superfamily)
MSYSLTPGYDGSLITGDKNIVQGKWSVNFQLNGVSDSNAPELFIKNVGNMQKARFIVTRAVEQAIVKVAAQMTVENFVKGKINNELIKKYSNRILDLLQSGLQINHISPETYSVPRLLINDFQAVNLAQSEKASEIEEAKRYSSEVLNETAGSDFQQIINAINSYDKKQAEMSLLEKNSGLEKISTLLNSPETGGRVSELLNNSKIYRTQTVEFVKGSSGRFAKLLEQHSQNPNILRNRLLQDTFEAVFSGNVKTYYLPTDKNKKIYIDIDKK